MKKNGRKRIYKEKRTPVWIMFMPLLIPIFIVGASLYSFDDYVLTGVLSLVMFPLFLGLSLSMYFSKPAILELTPEGFFYGNADNSELYQWKDIANFKTMTAIYHRETMKKNLIIVWKYKEDVQSKDQLSVISGKITGYDGGFLENFGMDSEYLVKILNDWRKQYS